MRLKAAGWSSTWIVTRTVVRFSSKSLIGMCEGDIKFITHARRAFYLLEGSLAEGMERKVTATGNVMMLENPLPKEE